MKGNRWWILAVGAALAFATSASAEEVVYFSNGTYMKVVSHEVRGDMVKVQLDGSGSIAFPARMIDKIESGSGVVFGGPTSGIFANQAAPRMAGAALGPPPGQTVVGVRSAEARQEDPDTIAAAKRAAEYRSTAMMPMSGRRAEMQYDDGTIAATRGAGPSGSQRLGNHFVVNPSSQNRGVFKPVRLQMKTGTAPVDAPQPDESAPPDADPAPDPGAQSGEAPPNP